MDNLKLIGTVIAGGNRAKNAEDQKYLDYWISPEGRLFKSPSHTGKLKEITPRLTSTNKYKGKDYGGYYAVSTNNLPEKYIHRMVALHFVDNDDPEVKTCVDHIDGNKHNNHYTNLEWVTRSENHKRMHARLRAQGVVWTGRRARL